MSLIIFTDLDNYKNKSTFKSSLKLKISCSIAARCGAKTFCSRANLIQALLYPKIKFCITNLYNITMNSRIQEVRLKHNTPVLI